MTRLLPGISVPAFQRFCNRGLCGNMHKASTVLWLQDLLEAEQLRCRRLEAELDASRARERELTRKLDEEVA